MLRELYTRDPSDPKYDSTILEHSNEIETLLGEIKMILYTKQGDILGSYNFGYNLEDQLFLFDLNEVAMKTSIKDAIYQYCPDAAKYNVEVEVEFYKGDVRDAALIDIIINDEKMLGIVIK